MNIFFQTIRQEINAIVSSIYKIFLLVFLPLSGFVLIVLIFKIGVLQELPIAVVDNDHSKLSRNFIYKLNSTKTLSIAYNPTSTKEAMELLKSTKVYGLVIIPKNFEKDFYTLTQPNLDVILNTQYILVGKIIKSTLADTFKDPTSVIQLQITPFFNVYQNYFVFLVSAILPAMWQILIVIVTLVSFGEIIKNKQEKVFFGTHIVLKTIAKLTPYTLYFMVLGMGYIFYIYGEMGWVFEGSIAVVAVAMLATIVAYQIIALFFLVVGFDYARALSLGAAYTAPAFAFLGVTFPVQSMGVFATTWKNLLPISHYMAIQISQANYGIFSFEDGKHLVAIMTFYTLGFVVYLRLKHRVAL